VVDVSIHPDLPTGNTRAMVIVVAEKVAKRILALSAGSTSTAGASSISSVISASATSPVVTLPGGTGGPLSTGAASSVSAVPAALAPVSSKAAALMSTRIALACYRLTTVSVTYLDSVTDLVYYPSTVLMYI